MSKLHLSTLFFAFLIIVGKESQGSTTLDLDTALIVPGFTPFDKFENINLGLIPKLAQKLAKDKIKTIVIGSYAGEGLTLGFRFRQALIFAWVTAARPLGLKVAVEVGGLAFRLTLKVVKFCAGLDIAAIFVLPEINYKAKTEEEIIGDLKTIAEVAPNLPIIYNDLKYVTNPVVCGKDVFKKAISEVPTLVGIATDMESAVYLQKEMGIKDKLIIVYTFDINAAVSANFISLSVMANLFPGIALGIVDAVDKRQYDKATELQLKLNNFTEITSNAKFKDIDFFSRPFLEYQFLVYRFLTGLDLKQRVPFREVDEVTANKIKAGLIEQGIEVKYDRK